MISRRKIISRSLDNLDTIAANNVEEEDVWYDEEKLFRDHINEVLAKWEQIDDEIWAKIIVFEKNRRVAKAYARSSVITINDSKHGFDGVHIGLNGFENPMRDSETKVIKKSIGEGFKLKMDDIGNILIKRYGKSSIYLHNTSTNNEETTLGADILQMRNMSLTANTSAKLFDMRKFTTNINREFSRSYPECGRLERQCISAITLVKSSKELINSPLWILIINVVAIDVLRNRLNALPKALDATAVRLSGGIGANEDPYSTIGSQVGLNYPTPSTSDESTSSKSKRNSLYAAGNSTDENHYQRKPECEIYNQTVSMFSRRTQKPVQQRKKQDDPYYCGFLARIPNFIKSSKLPNKSNNKKEAKIARKISASQQQLLHMQQHHHQQHQHQHKPHQQHLPKVVPILPAPMPIAAFHQQYLSAQNYYPYKLFAQHYKQRRSQSQMSLWDSRSLISAHE